MPAWIKNPKDFFAGLLFLAIVAVFAYGLRELPIGSAFRMGPGYFPMVLLIILTGLGIAILVNGLRVKGEPLGMIPWRGLILITAPIVFFGATLKGLGLIASLGITVFATTLASREWNVLYAVATTAVLVIFSWLVFVKGLGLPISLRGPWIGGY
jgi:hypothetical protein